MDNKGINLVFHAARRKWDAGVRSDVSFLDLVAWGYEGVCRAEKTFDPVKAGFTIYAWWWVRKMMQRGLAEWSGYKANSPGWMRDISHGEYSDEALYVEGEHKEGEDRRRLKKELWRRVFALPERCRGPLFVKYYFGLRDVEVAEVLGLVDEAGEWDEREVKNAVRAGIKMLRKQYAEKK